MRQSRPPVPAAAGSSLDTVTRSGRKAASEVPGGETADQIDLPGFEDTQDFTGGRPLSRPERRRLNRTDSPCCTGKVVYVDHSGELTAYMCQVCHAVYLYRNGSEQYALVDTRTNRPLRLAVAPTP